MKLTFYLILLLVCCFAFTRVRSKELQDPEAFKPKLGDLEVTLLATKQRYKRDDKIELEIKLTNNNPVKDIFVYGTLQFGVRASFRLFVAMQKGKKYRHGS